MGVVQFFSVGTKVETISKKIFTYDDCVIVIPARSIGVICNIFIGKDVEVCFDSGEPTEVDLLYSIDDLVYGDNNV